MSNIGSSALGVRELLQAILKIKTWSWFKFCMDIRLNLNQLVKGSGKKEPLKTEHILSEEKIKVQEEEKALKEEPIVTQENVKVQEEELTMTQERPKRK